MPWSLCDVAMNCVLGELSNLPLLLSPGQSGLGKSTLINTLFKSKISRKSVQPISEERIPKTIEIKSITHGQHQRGCLFPEHGVKGEVGRSP